MPSEKRLHRAMEVRARRISQSRTSPSALNVECVSKYLSRVVEIWRLYLADTKSLPAPFCHRTPCTQEVCSRYDRTTASSLSMRLSYNWTLPSPKLAAMKEGEYGSADSDVSGLSDWVTISYIIMSMVYRE